MAVIDGELWRFNFARVKVVDVSDDYRLMQPPLPSDCYPVLMETYVPVHRLDEMLSGREWVQGYLYDWHEPEEDGEAGWIVGVVRKGLLEELERAGMAVPPA
ncbi:MAG TPA: hypothetical protein DER07_05870 [Armatimonadetes bacterium]|nr:hypothetical protein [Armatimonadota bacterium]HCE00549.1 hypothetical protein [Armatimonadota bacterium]